MTMRKVIATLLMIILGTPVLSGVGDVYYCYGVGESTSVGNYTGQTITGEGESFNRKFTFKWTEEGLIGLSAKGSGKNKVDIPLEVIDYYEANDGTEFFRTVDAQKPKELLSITGLTSTQYFYNNGRFTSYNLSAKVAYISYAQCEKY